MATKITADRCNALKAKVKEECQRRSKSGSVASYAGTAYDYSVVPAPGVKATEEHRNKIAGPLHAINSNKVPKAEAGKTIILESDFAAMEAFVTTLKARSVTDHQGTDCVSGCTGMCYGCTGTCYNSCSGCGGSCSYNCSGGCEDDCDDCGGACSAGCSHACSYNCSGSCDADCEDNCYSGCGAECSFDCTGTCSALCEDTCTNDCTGGCSAVCSDTCGTGVSD